MLRTGAENARGREGSRTGETPDNRFDGPHPRPTDPVLHDLIDLAASAKVSQDRVRHLLDAVLSVGSDLSLRNVMRRIVIAGCELVGARYGALAALGAGGEVVEFTHTGVDPATEAAIGALPSGEGVLGLVIEAAGPIRLDHVAAHPAAAGFPEDHPRMGSFIGVPIRARGVTLGALYLADKVGDESFTEEDDDVLGALAAAAGLAIENARMYRASHRREQWLRATNEVTSVLRTGPEPGEGLRLVAARARAVPGAAIAAVCVPDGPKHLVVRAGDGAFASTFHGLRIPIVDSITGDVFSTGRGRMIEQLGKAAFARSAHTFQRLPGPIADLGPAMFVPLRTGPHPLGVLIVAKYLGATPFGEDDLRMVENYAGHAAQAMEFAEAQQDRHRLALFEERDRIARDLHDLVIQRLFAVGIGMQGMCRGLDDSDVVDRLSTYVADIDQTIREIRRSIFSLQEPANGPYSLRGEILRTISDATVSLGYEPTVRLEGPLDSVVPPDAHGDLIATLRESLSNVVRHAHASGVQVTVAVDRRATRLELLVQDDGVGLPDDLPYRSGLANMVQRAHHWDGHCDFEIPARGGTRVCWTVPLPRHPDADPDEETDP